LGVIFSTWKRATRQKKKENEKKLTDFLQSPSQ